MRLAQRTDERPDGPAGHQHRRPGEDESVKLSRTIVNKVLADKTGILSADASVDGRFQASESIANFTIRSMMCVPLLGLDGSPWASSTSTRKSTQAVSEGRSRPLDGRGRTGGAVV